MLFGRYCALVETGSKDDDCFPLVIVQFVLGVGELFKEWDRGGSFGVTSCQAQGPKSAE
jgi:hypothetical protein